MSLNFYAPEEVCEKEESINNYKSLFSSYKNLKLNLPDSLYQMFENQKLSNIKCKELTQDILNKCKSKIDQRVAKIKNKYKNISIEEAYIICSYTCESKESEYSPYKILNKNLVSENRKNGVDKVSKYLYILLKTLRKLPRFYPPKNINYLYRCITQKVNLEKDNFNSKSIPYKIGEKKTFWGFTSTTTNPESSYLFLKDGKELKSGTIFSLEGDVWGYDIEVFNYFGEKEILLEPERKFIVKNVLPPINEIIYITCGIIESPLILLDNEINGQNNIFYNKIKNENINKNKNGKVENTNIKNSKNIPKKEIQKQSQNNEIQQKGKFEQNKISGNSSNVHDIKWVDYSSKYGFGYLLNNGHVGVYFNDSTIIIYKPNGTNFFYIKENTKEKGIIVKEHKFIENFDEDLNKKIIILENFKAYLLEENKNSPIEKKEIEYLDIINYVYVKRWMRTKHAIFFRLNNKIMQFKFLDQTELIWHYDNKLVIYKDSKGQSYTYSISGTLDSKHNEIIKYLGSAGYIIKLILKKNGQKNMQSSNNSEQQSENQCNQ